MALTSRKRLLFTLAAVAPTLLLALLVVVLGLKAFKARQQLARDKAFIQGRAFKHLEVPLENFRTYTTLPTNSRFTTFVYKPGDLVTTYSINSHGMRDSDFPRRKPAGEYRIALFGDSFTEGVLIEQDRIYPAHLQRILNSGSLPGGVKQVRVMNFGMRGEFPRMYVARLTDQAMRFSPDMVIVQTFDNDAWDYFRHLPVGSYRNRLDYMYEASNFWRNAIANPVRDLERIRRICEKKKLPLVVFHISSQTFLPGEVDYHDPKYESQGVERRRRADGTLVNDVHDAIQNWAQDNGVTFLSMEQAFRRRKADDPQRYYIPDDGHFNEHGHALAAEELAKVVRQKMEATKHKR